MGKRTRETGGRRNGYHAERVPLVVDADAIVLTAPQALVERLAELAVASYLAGRLPSLIPPQAPNDAPM